MLIERLKAKAFGIKRPNTEHRFSIKRQLTRKEKKRILIVIRLSDVIKIITDGRNYKQKQGNVK